MWSNPHLLNRLSNALFAASALAVVGAACYGMARSPAFPLRAIEVVGKLEHVRRPQVVGALQGQVSGTFFTADLGFLRERFQSIPWVRRAEIRRHWPDRLQVTLDEHVPLARWGRPEDAQLLNRQGEPFYAASSGDLPVLSGPEGTERLMASRYGQFLATLAPLGVVPTEVLLSERFAWQVKLENGVWLQLGREQPRDPVNERLARFVEAYPRTIGKLDARLHGDGMRVDLRYANGFAVRVPGLERTNSGRAARPRA